MAKSVSNINIGVMANTTGLSAGLKLASRDVSTFVSTTSGIGTGLKNINTNFVSSAASAAKWGTALAGAAIAGAAYMYKQTTDLVSAQVDLASSMNISVAALAGLDRAADLSGSSVETMHKAIEQMNKRIGEASMNTDKAADIQAKYGVSVRELLAMPTEQRFMKIAETMRGMSNETQKAAFANQMFGKSGMDLINTLNMGGAGLQGIIQETQLYGVALSQLDASRVEESGDALANVGTVIQGVQMQLTAQLAPAVIDIANRFTEWAISGGGVGEKVGGAIDYVIQKVGQLGNMWQQMTIGFFEFASTVNSVLASVSGGFDGLIGDAKLFFEDMDAMSGKGRGEGMISNALQYWAPTAGEGGAAMGPSDTEKFFQANVAESEAQIKARSHAPQVSDTVDKWWKDVNAAPASAAQPAQMAAPDTTFADQAIANLAEPEKIKPQKLVDLETLDSGISKVQDIADMQSDITDEIKEQNKESGQFKSGKASEIGVGVGSVTGGVGGGSKLPAMQGIATTPIDHFAASATANMQAAGQQPTTGQRGTGGGDSGMLAALQGILAAARETAVNTRQAPVATLG